MAKINGPKPITLMLLAPKAYAVIGDPILSNKELYVKLIKAFKDIDFTQFTIEELKTFDFQMWNDDVILMPIWALDCLKDGTELVSMSGGEIIFNKERGLDKDTRFGCTAYGFNKSQLRDSKLDNILQ